MTEKPPLRVVLNHNDRGEFTVYSDPGVEVIWRSAHTPGDELYRVDPERIPAGWLDNIIGYAGDGSQADAIVECLADALAGVSRSKTKLH